MRVSRLPNEKSPRRSGASWIRSLVLCLVLGRRWCVRHVRQHLRLVRELVARVRGRVSRAALLAGVALGADSDRLALALLGLLDRDLDLVLVALGRLVDL